VFGDAVVSKSVPDLQHTDSFRSKPFELPKNAALAAGFALPVNLIPVLTFCHKRPNATPGELRVSRWHEISGLVRAGGCDWGKGVRNE
jgi:hypothetical protein